MSKNPTDKSAVGEIKTEIEFDIEKFQKKQ